MKIKIPSNLLKAVSYFAANPKEGLDRLSVVLVETTATHVRLTGMNGPALLSLRFVNDTPDVVPEPFVIPFDLLLKLPDRGEVLVEVSDDSIALTSGGVSKTAPKPAKEYPDYRRAVPRTVTGEPALYSTKTLGLFEKACSAIYGKRAGASPIQLLQNGHQAAIVAFSPTPDADIVGVLMSYRNPWGTSELVSETPAWLHEEE